MYRIVIADDEEYVRELVAKNINQSQSEFEVVGKAENGLHAMELVLSSKPDILITDISMPFMDGLELIRKIQELDQSIKTVIISGYDDFSYAKQALTLGVTDYLLKPFLPSELFEVLNKIKGEIEHQKTLLQNIQSMKNQLEDNRQFLQEHFLKNLFQNIIDKKNIIEESKKVKIDLDTDYYAVGILQLQQNMSKKKQNFKEFLAIIKDEYFSQNIRTYLANLNDSQVAMLFCGNFRNVKSFCNAVEDGINAINDSMRKYYDMNMYCTIGSITIEVEHIPNSYNDALSVWKKVLSLANTILFYDDEKQNNPEDIDAWERPKDLENNLLMNIQMGRTEKSLECLNEILQFYESMDVQLSEFISTSLVEMVHNISDALLRADGKNRVWEEKNLVELLKRNFTYGSLRDAKEILEKYIIKSCETFSSINEKQGDKIVFNVKDLIEKNIGNEEFNLESASAGLFFSPNYVRQIFKQITGESFMGYLIRRRMETAKLYLQNPSYMIGEIALKTGYNNQRYFASCFKKYYGCTPTEYRRQIEQKNLVD
jgi:two-component system response regulator YesN